MGKRKSRHQAEPTEIVRLKTRIGYRGRCRCRWSSPYVRATAESAADDTSDHIKERS